MAGQTIINFDSFLAEAASALASGMAETVRTRIETVVGQLRNLSGEEAARIVRIVGSMVADGNCGNGCA